MYNGIVSNVITIIITILIISATQQEQPLDIAVRVHGEGSEVMLYHIIL